jgi:hypothetical protein
MLALAEILGLIILNALIHTAFTRWKIARRTAAPKRTSKVRIATHYPLHPSPVASALSFDGAPEHAAHIRPAGLDW